MKPIKALRAKAIVVIAPLLFFVLGYCQALAIEHSPVIVTTTIDPGNTYEETIRITNDNSETKSYEVRVMPFRAKENGTEPDFVNLDLSEAEKLYLNWVELTGGEKITLEPGEIVRYDYKINVPKTAEAGGYYFGILFKDTEIEQTAGNEVGLSGMSGPIFLLTVSGDLQPGFEIESFTTSELKINLRNLFKKDTEQQKGIDIETRIKNTGNIHLKPNGKITLLKGGKEVDSLDFNHGKDSKVVQIVLPDSTRLYKNKFTIEKLPLLWANYQTKILVQDQGIERSAQTGFLFINWVTIIIIIVILITLTLIWSFMLSSARKQARKEKGK
ncbi:MAG: hypothetical protein GF332_02495 [Candidatus Moranbacteria bacterium]|nr:hypothetical protein [Candidatus Moranbacteria bacterium]